MLTLAIECATKSIGLALLNEEEVCAEFYLNLGRHHTEILLPALDKLFLLTGHAPEEVDLLACTVGPGSFTGLRIGVSTVKGLALAMARPVVGVSTLEALAVNAIPSRGLICPMLDARKNQVYAGSVQDGAGWSSRSDDTGETCRCRVIFCMTWIKERLSSWGTARSDMKRSLARS